MDISRILNTPTIERSFPSEVEETPEPLSPSQASIQSWDSQNGQNPRPEFLLSNFKARVQTSRDARLMIKTALLFKVPWSKIREKLSVTNHQIALAKRLQLTPQHKRCGRKPKLSTPHRQRLEQWLQESLSHWRIAYRHIGHTADLGLDCGEKAIRTGFKLLGYGRKTSKRKGFSQDPEVCVERFAFAREGITWTPERLFQQIFSDEVWAHGGAYTQQYVTCKLDNSDRYSSENLTYKYGKLPAWMFHATIVNGQKGPATFWEKAWGSIDSAKYDIIILNNIDAFLTANPGRGFIWI